MTISNVGSAVELNEMPPSVSTRDVIMPTVQAGDAALLFLNGAAGGAAYGVTDNGLTVPFTAVGSAVTDGGQTSQVYQVAGLSAADTGKTITIATTVGGNPQLMKIAGGLRVIRGAHPTDLIDAYDTKVVNDVATLAPTSKALTTVLPNCGQVHFMAPTRGSVPAFLAMSVNGSQGVTGDFEAYTGVTASLSAACVAYSYTALGAGTSIGAKTFTTDQECFYTAWTISIRPPDSPAGYGGLAFGSAFNIAPDFTI